VEAVNLLLKNGVDVEQAVTLVADIKTQHGDTDLMQYVNAMLEKIKHKVKLNEC